MNAENLPLPIYIPPHALRLSALLRYVRHIWMVEIPSTMCCTSLPSSMLHDAMLVA